MPELNVLLALFPAEENFFPANQGWKINQSSLQVFDLDFTTVKFEQQVFGVGEGTDPVIDRFSSQVLAGTERSAKTFVEFVQFCPQFCQSLQPLFDAGKQRTSLVTRVMLFEAMLHDL